MARNTESEKFLEKLRSLSHPDGSAVRVLVAEDDPHVADLVSLGLRMADWEVRIAHDGPEAVKLAKEFTPDVLVLDIMMPTFDGLTALERIRAFQPEVLALFLTAKDSVNDRVEGLDAGADDYLTKPFSMDELQLRLYRMICRSGLAVPAENELVVADLVLNEDTREATRGGALIELTTTQFELLRFLMENAKTVVSKSQILDSVWHSENDHTNIVELYISYLRKKIDTEGKPALIHTIRGAGYVLKPPR